MRPPSLIMGQRAAASSAPARTRGIPVAAAAASARRPLLLRPVARTPPPLERRRAARRRALAPRSAATTTDDGQPAAAAAAAASPSARRRPPNSPLTPPYGVVVTGGSKGIGRALALEFLRAGDRVVICSRDGDAAQRAADALAREAGLGDDGDDRRIHAIAADVSKPSDVRALAAFARAKLGDVDLWVNNAGTNAYKYGPLLDSDDAALARIVETNVLGVLLCCREAVRLMKDQAGGGHVFNMDGAGADGNATPRFAAYGATKRSLAQLGASLRAELGLAGIRGVGVHDLSPGMVATELLLSGARDTKAARFFVNALAEEAKDVAAFLVPRVRAVPAGAVAQGGGTGGVFDEGEAGGGGAAAAAGGGGSDDGGRRAATPGGFLAAAAGNSGGGVPPPVYIRKLTRPQALVRILARLLTGARKGRFVEED